jgi:predicted transcriptional regulator
MIKVLEEAIAKVLTLSEMEQEEAAQVLLWALERHDDSPSLDEQTIAAIDEGIAQGKRGDFATDDEIAALWKRHGL